MQRRGIVMEHPHACNLNLHVAVACFASCQQVVLPSLLSMSANLTTVTMRKDMNKN